MFSCYFLTEKAKLVISVIRKPLWNSFRRQLCHSSPWTLTFTTNSQDVSFLYQPIFIYLLMLLKWKSRIYRAVYTLLFYESLPLFQPWSEQNILRFQHQISGNTSSWSFENTSYRRIAYLKKLLELIFYTRRSQKKTVAGTVKVPCFIYYSSSNRILFLDNKWK